MTIPSWTMLLRSIAVAAFAVAALRSARADGNICDWDERCWRTGRCDQNGTDDDDPPCVATPQSCERSVACLVHGFCSFSRDGALDGAPWCRPTAESCLASDNCLRHGRCHLIAESGGPACAAATDAHCQATEACRRVGRCAVDESSRSYPVCVETPAGCAKSTRCSDEGRCAFRAGEGCVADDAERCAASKGCALAGRCDARSGKIDCVPTSTEHCVGSELCRLGGACTYDPAGGGCIRSDADCAGAPACSERGQCSAGEFGERCVVREGACRESRVCGAFGACTFSRAGGHEDSCQPETLGENWTSAVHLPALRVTRVRVSSTQPRGKTYTYDARDLIDGKLDTAWQPRSTASGGVGAKLTLRLAQKAVISSVLIANGFQRVDASGDLFVANSRIRYAYITVGRGPKQLIHFGPHERGWSEFAVTSVKTDTITLEVLETYPGTTWNDLAISEIAIHESEPFE